MKKIFNKYKVFIALLILICGILLPSKIPYINLFSQQIDIIIVWLFIIILFSFKWRYLFMSGVSLLILICGLTLFKKDLMAEILGNSLYLIFLSATLSLFIQEVRNNK